MQKMLGAWQKNDLEGLMSVFADDAVWYTQGDPQAIPYCGTYSGKDAIQGYFIKQAGMIKATSFIPVGIIGGDNDEQQVFFAQETVEVLATKKSYKTDFAMVFTFKNGQVSRVVSLMDTLAVAKAFEA